MIEILVEVKPSSVSVPINSFIGIPLDGQDGYVLIFDFASPNKSKWVPRGSGEGGEAGPPGPSAYQVAVANGFVGTEAQWLASLRGNPGAPGTPGANGQSAYQIALANGFVGTEDQWLEGLHGEDGDPGAPGAPGSPGANGQSAYQIALANGFVGTEAQWLGSLHGDDGDPGAPGNPGSPGANGQSAYQIALANGFVGTESQWLASLHGDDGDPGTPGAPGAPGSPGSPGSNGLSAYQVALANGFVGTEAQWLASLVGPPGSTTPFFRTPLYAEDFLNDPTTTINPWTGASVGTGGSVSTAPVAAHYDGNRQGILLARSGSNANSGYRYMTGLSKIRLKGGEIARFIVCPSSGSTLSIFRIGFQDSNTNADPVDGCWFTVTSTGLVTAYCASNSSSSNQPFANIDPAGWYYFFINVVSPTQTIFTIFSMLGVQIETKTITSNIPTDAGRQTGHGFVAWNTGTNAHDVINIDYMDMQFGPLARG